MIKKNNIKYIGEKSKNKKKWELKKEEPWLSKVGNCWNANWVLEKGDSELLQVDDYPPSFWLLKANPPQVKNENFTKTEKIFRFSNGTWPNFISPGAFWLLGP